MTVMLRTRHLFTYRQVNVVSRLLVLFIYIIKPTINDNRSLVRFRISNHAFFNLQLRHRYHVFLFILVFQSYLVRRCLQGIPERLFNFFPVLPSFGEFVAVCGVNGKLGRNWLEKITRWNGVTITMIPGTYQLFVRFVTDSFKDVFKFIRVDRRRQGAPSVFVSQKGNKCDAKRYLLTAIYFFHTNVNNTMIVHWFLPHTWIKRCNATKSFKRRNISVFYFFWIKGKLIIAGSFDSVVLIVHNLRVARLR